VAVVINPLTPINRGAPPREQCLAKNTSPMGRGTACGGGG